MIDSSILNEPQLARTYLVANTPSYLLRHYRAEPSVYDLATRNTVDDLVSFASEVANDDKRKLKEVVFAYATIVALTFKNQSEVNEKLTNISFQKLDWAEKILSFAEHNQAANIKIEVRIPPRIDQQLKQSSSESSITVPIEVR